VKSQIPEKLEKAVVLYNFNKEEMIDLQEIK